MFPVLSDCYISHDGNIENNVLVSTYLSFNSHKFIPEDWV